MPTIHAFLHHEFTTSRNKTLSADARTEILNEDGERIYIPNLKFNEDVVIISPRKNLIKRCFRK